MTKKEIEKGLADAFGLEEWPGKKVSNSTKSREQRIRRALAKDFCKLVKSRARNWSADNQLGYMIVSADNNVIQYGEHFELTLEDVERIVFE